MAIVVRPLPREPRSIARPGSRELTQGRDHGPANRPNAFRSEPGSKEIRFDPQPFQGIRLRPVEPPRDRRAVRIECRDLGRFPGRAPGKEPDDAVTERLVFADQSLDPAPTILALAGQDGVWSRCLMQSWPFLWDSPRISGRRWRLFRDSPDGRLRRLDN